ncbi:MAG: ABC transporter permease [Chloroflexota bacterium]
MAQYLLRRVLQTIPLLVLISFGLFLLMNSIGDPLSVYAESRKPPTGKAREELIRRLGLDKPLPEQYLVWLIGNDWMLTDVRGDGTLMEPGTRHGVLRGDLGTSSVTRRDAKLRIQERLPNTLILMVPSYLIVILLSLSIGIYSAIRQYSLLDNIVTTISFVLYSLPIFFIALMVIYIFGVQFQQWGLPSLPVAGMYDPREPETLGGLLQHMVLPVFCLVAIQVGGYVRYIRSSMLEVLSQDYIRTARAKGLEERRTIFVHALKNAAMPLVTLIGLDLPFLLAGAIVTERIFAWPGLGRLFIESLERSDITVMMAILMLLSIAVVVFQLLTDVVYTWLDPRIRYT